MKQKKKPKSVLKSSYSVSALSRLTGADRKTIDKAIVRGKIEPVRQVAGFPQYRLEDVQAALVSKPDKTLKDEKLSQEIRRLKLRNDQTEGKLIERSIVNAAITGTLGPLTTMLTQKLENEAPAICVGLDIPGIRVKMKQLNDAIRADFSKLVEAWPE